MTTIGIIIASIAVVLLTVLIYLVLKKSSNVDTIRSLQELAGEQSKTALLSEQVRDLSLKNEGLQEQLSQKISALVEAQTHNKELERQLSVQKEELENMNARLKIEFENIAHKITKASTEELSKSNLEKMEGILSPFSDRLGELKKQMSDAYDKELRDKTALRTEIEQLMQLNKQMSAETIDLTRALKGDSKKQGNWGELVLERVLDLAGLEKGREYEREIAVEGGKYRPDVIVHLPENKHIIIDSKVSLTSYEQMVNAEDEETVAKMRSEHINSIKRHIDELSAKNYQNLKAFDTPNFVLMFIPIESSFSMAVQAEKTLYDYALKKNVVMVTPSTLLATLRTVASIWQHEKQNRNTLEIARLSGALYEKLYGLVGDILQIGKGLETVYGSYSAVLKKLSTGQGNALNTAEKIKGLGAKTTKSIPGDYAVKIEERMDKSLPEIG